MKGVLREFVVNQLKVKIFRDRKEMGEAAGWAVAEKMRGILKTKRPLSVVFASAPSQNEFLEALGQSPGIDWSEVTALHLDEYVGLSSEAPQSFGLFLREKLFEKVHPGMVFYLNGIAEDLEAECRQLCNSAKDASFGYRLHRNPTVASLTLK